MKVGNLLEIGQKLYEQGSGKTAEILSVRNINNIPHYEVLFHNHNNSSKVLLSKLGVEKRFSLKVTTNDRFSKLASLLK